jgi:hypothetical protein
MLPWLDLFFEISIVDCQDATFLEICHNFSLHTSFRFNVGQTETSLHLMRL